MQHSSPHTHTHTLTHAPLCPARGPTPSPAIATWGPSRHPYLGVRGDRRQNLAQHGATPCMEPLAGPLQPLTVVVGHQRPLVLQGAGGGGQEGKGHIHGSRWCRTLAPRRPSHTSTRRQCAHAAYHLPMTTQHPAHLGDFPPPLPLRTLPPPTPEHEPEHESVWAGVVCVVCVWWGGGGGSYLHRCHLQRAQGQVPPEFVHVGHQHPTKAGCWFAPAG